MTDVHVVNFWQTISIAMFSILSTTIIFWIGIVRHLLRKEDIVELIELHSPYLQERESIMTRLEITKECQNSFSQALQKNTQVMAELKTQLAVLSKTLEQIEKRIEQRDNKNG